MISSQQQLAQSIDLTRSSPPCALFVANRAFGLAKSRLLIMQELIANGWCVLAAGKADDSVAKLIDIGVEFTEVRFARGGIVPHRDIGAYQRLARLYRERRPRLIHHFQAKPVILGGIAARHLFATTVINTITGLGHAFIRGGLAKWLSIAGYRQTLGKSAATIFQNSDDLELFVTRGMVEQSKTRLIISSGVDVHRFVPSTTEGGDAQPLVVMVSRLLWEKGVGEFVEAAKQCKRRWPSATFQLVGEIDLEHPDAVPEHTLKEWVDAGHIEYLGYTSTIEQVLQQASIAVLPSYREGAPRVLLEAAACGVPTVTADVPGCREAIKHEKTGLLVPVQDATSLADAVERLLANPTERKRMGEAGVKWMSEEFDEKIIAKKHLDIYREVGVAI